MATSEKACCVPRCGKTREDKIILHSFPNPDTDKERYLAWIEAVGSTVTSLDEQNVYKNRKVCHAHFETKYLTWSRRLIPGAVPTLHMPETGALKKRGRGPSDEADAMEDSKRPKPGSFKEAPTMVRMAIPGSFKEAPTMVRMAIIAEGHPRKTLSAGMVRPIQGIIWDLLEKAPDPLPIINMGNIVAGALHIQCDGSRAEELLSNLNGRVVEGTKLKVILAEDLPKDLPKPVKMAWKTRNVGCTNTDRVLRMLQRMNPGLKTEEWKVVNTLVEATYTRRIVLMDKGSAAVIKGAGYVLQTGVDRGVFKLISEEKDGRDASPAPVVTGRTDGQPTKVYTRSKVNPKAGASPVPMAWSVSADHLAATGARGSTSSLASAVLGLDLLGSDQEEDAAAEDDALN